MSFRCADNAHPHTTKASTQLFEENRMKPVPLPLNSPDLASSDFHMFGCLKGRLTGLSFKGAERLVETVRAVLEGIKSDPASGPSRADGPFAEMYRCQWTVSRLR